MPPYDFMEFTLADGSRVRVELAPVGGPEAETETELPSGVGGVVPVGLGARVSSLATDALHAVLRPLGPVLQQVHDSVRNVPDPPDSITVDFGVQIGQDLTLGIVGANGQSSLTVSATWQLRPGGN
ncbi:CU044_2847 family protein [Streptomyces sp. BR1]|uniref:CU044_2847 family protein n=1 Tax=Streptomyces sp. BR1 TaxID=1592323 RepID=UPI00402B9938